MKRLPDIDKVSWPQGVSSKGLKSNCSIFCPYMKSFAAITANCYNCELGFNESCKALNWEIKLQPSILKEIYRCVSELHRLETTDFYIFHKKKLLKDTPKLKLSKSPIYFVINSFSVVNRFIPRYEKLDSPYKDSSFCKEGLNTIFDYSEIGDKCKTGDIVYEL